MLDDYLDRRASIQAFLRQTPQEPSDLPTAIEQLRALVAGPASTPQK